MQSETRLKIAIQKNGRLNNESMDLLRRCGLKIKPSPSSLLCHVENLPIDLLFVRDDDIPVLILDQICDIGIVGENVLQEKTLEWQTNGSKKNCQIAKKLNFCKCKLAIAYPIDKPFVDVATTLQNRRIATSYPNLLKAYLDKEHIQADIVNITGSVEIAPRLDIADAICDLVSTGRTLEENNLQAVQTVMESEAVLIKTEKGFPEEKAALFNLILSRIDSVLKAQESKYVMFHAPKTSLSAIKALLPGCETPTINTLEGVKDKVAVHVVSSEGIFWGTLEKLKQAGASSILVLPIEKMLN